MDQLPVGFLQQFDEYIGGLSALGMKEMAAEARGMRDALVAPTCGDAAEQVVPYKNVAHRPAAVAEDGRAV